MELSVDEAIKKGKRMVNYPVMAISLLLLAICFYFGYTETLPAWIFPAGFGFAFLSGWIWWSFMITKWRLWAFENVRNVHELKKRAIQEKLIWPDSSIFEKTEIRSAAEKEKWAILQDKFKKEDYFDEDHSLSRETVIYYSKGKNFFEMAIMFACMAVGKCIPWT